MDPIAEIAKRLTPDQSARSVVADGDIEVAPPNAEGFAVRLQVGNSEYLVFFDGWHEHFSEPAEAVECFMLGLGSRCRLKITSYGDFRQKWVLETCQDGRWSEDSTTGLLFFPFWRRKRLFYKSNVV